MLKKMQRWTTIWILEIFCTSPTMGLEAIASLILIQLYLWKLSSRNQLQIVTLPFNHIIKLLLERRHNQNSQKHCLTLENTMSKQQQKLKSFIIDMNNCLNGLFSSFDPLNDIFHPGHRLINIFPSCFSINVANHTSDESKTTYCKKLDKIVIKLSSDPRTVIVISNTSIQNNVTISITHIHSFNNPLKKTLHHTINATSTKAELFTIRCSINQTIQIQHASHIIVITDIIHAIEF